MCWKGRPAVAEMERAADFWLEVGIGTTRGIVNMGAGRADAAGG